MIDNEHKNIWQALSAAKLEFGAIGKTSKAVTGQDKNGKEKSYQYAPLEDYIAATTAALSRHDLFVTFCAETQFSETPFYKVTAILHWGGGEGTQSLESSITMPIVQVLAPPTVTKAVYNGKEYDKIEHKNIPQLIGSINTYAKRYAYGNLLGIAAGGEDNDGSDLKPGDTIVPIPGPEFYTTEVMIAKVQELELALGETDSDVRLFLQKLGVDQLDDLTIKGVNTAFALLQAKKRKLALAAAEKVGG